MGPRFPTMPIVQALDRLTRWPNALRSMGNSLAARLTIVVPVLGYFLLLNDHVVTLLKGHSSLCNGHACDAPLRLQLLFLGGSLYGLAAAIYTIACPHVIQRFADASEYFLAQRDYFANSDNLSFLHYDIKRRGGTARETGMIGGPSAIADILAEHYVVLSYSAFSARVAPLSFL
jgi:hypothetical protein